MATTMIGLIEKFIIHILYASLVMVYRLSRTLIERKHPLVKLFMLLLIILLFVVVNIASYYRLMDFYLLIFLTSFALLIYVTGGELKVLWLLGIVGGDQSIAKGIDYKRALEMCTDSFDFLGIGASKLTNEREPFRTMVKRCNRDDRPIRLLLCPPDHSHLLEVARQANRPEAEYRDRVKMSLDELRYLKDVQKMNIEVRFYSDIPLFRLMFVNDNLCLASHYILGEGDGSQLPQMHIIKRPLWKREKDSLYYPLNRYFLKMWAESRSWDFSQYLQ